MCACIVYLRKFLPHCVKADENFIQEKKIIMKEKGELIAGTSSWESLEHKVKKKNGHT